MGSIEIFANPLYINLSIISLLILLLATIYSSFGLNINKGIWYLFIGLVIEFCSSWYGYSISYSTSSVSISVLVAIELFFILFAVVFLALAASEILVGNVPATAYVATATVAGIAAIVFFCFIAPDGDMISNMRRIFPIAGFAYIMASFWSQCGRRHNAGYLLAAIVTSVVTFFLVMRLFGVEYFTEHTWYISPLTYLGLALAIVMIKSDYTQDRLDDSAGEMDKYNQRLEGIIKSSPFPIIISRLSDDKILLANNNAIKLFGILPSELDRYKLRDFFVDADNRHLLNDRLEKEREVHDFEILVKAVNGDTPFWLLTSANVIDYNYDIALYSAFQDITTRKNRENLLKNQAVRDPLTSLFNRRYFEDEVNKRIALNPNDSYSVLMIDADHFKRVNDTYGHKIGDKVLIELSSTAERALREDDIVARYGGEEFVVFLPKLSADEAKIVADRLRETISKIVVYSDQGDPIQFTVSIGISSSAISDNIDMLVKTSDEALYRAKSNGRNRCEIFTLDDLATFNASIEHKDESANHHPAFDKENSEEISLLDGVDANHIINNQTQIEKPAPAAPQAAAPAAPAPRPQTAAPHPAPVPPAPSAAPVQSAPATPAAQAKPAPQPLKPAAPVPVAPPAPSAAPVPPAMPVAQPQSDADEAYPLMGIDNDDLK